MISDARTITNALSFDIEDWFHLVDIDAVADPARWPSLPTLVEERTRWILSALRDKGVKATFFMLGWVADRHTALVRDIASEGHEIASHGYWHRPVFSQSPGEFRDDVRRSLDAIARAWSGPVIGYRAPSFSIRPGVEWAFDVLADLGFAYDASLFPARRAHGGYPCAAGPHEVRGPGGGRLGELPMSVATFGPARLAFSGGGYMRLLPSPMIRRGFEQVNRAGRPVVVYLHPRDFAIDCPRVPMSVARRFKCYVGLRTTAGKLRRLLEDRRFGTCESVLRDRGLIASQEEAVAR